MLYKFLESNRSVILSNTEEKTLRLAGILPSSERLQKGLPLFLEQLISILKDKNPQKENSRLLDGAAKHGKELLLLGYSLSHVVHSYGAMCQAITELAADKNSNIQAHEFNDLNQSLDIAIASAVSEFEFHSTNIAHEKEVQHMGFLVHELRNALSSATIANQMIKKGVVGTGGSTAKVLEENLARMRTIIDRSLLDIRMRTDPEILVEKFFLHNLISQIVTTAAFEALGKNQILSADTNAEIEIQSDRQLLLSAIANFVQNAMKYTKTNGNIIISTILEKNDRVRIEITDECGGLPEERIANLFEPFTKEGLDQSGLGLGLTISQRAISLIQGSVSVRNNTGKGCTFVIDIPKVYTPKTAATSTISKGIDSVQPGFRKR